MLVAETPNGGPTNVAGDKYFALDAIDHPSHKENRPAVNGI